MSPMPPVEAGGISGEQTPHYNGNRHESRSQKQMKMVGDQRPSITGGLGFLKFLPEAVQEIIPIAVVSKDRLSVNSPDDDVMQRPRRIDS